MKFTNNLRKGILIKKFTSVYSTGNISNSSTKLIKKRVKDRNNAILFCFFKQTKKIIFTIQKHCKNPHMRDFCFMQCNFTTGMFYF